MTEVLRVPEGEPIPTIERLDVWFKKRLAKASAEQEAEIRDEWARMRMKLYGQPLPNPGSQPESFPTIHRLDRFFARKIALARSKEEANAIKRARVAAERRFWAEQEQHAAAEAKAIEDATKAIEAPEKAEADAIEQARKMYGHPAGAGGGMPSGYASHPMEDTHG